MNLQGKGKSAARHLKRMKNYSYAKLKSDFSYQSHYKKIKRDIETRAKDENTKTAIVVHLFYPEAWEQISKRIKLIRKFQYDVFVSLPPDKIDFGNKIISDFPGAYIYESPNQGRDVLPFMAIAASLSSAGYRYVLKIHSKKSTHRKDGQDWFTEIINNLIPSNDKVQQSIVELLHQSKTSIIGPAKNYTSLVVNFEANGEHMTEVVKKIYGKNTARTVLQTNRKEYGFFAGTMLWVKLDSIEPLLKIGKVGRFEAEKGQIDATYAHALERLLCVVPEIEKQRIYEVDNNGVREIGYSDGIIPDWSEVYIGPKPE